MKKFAIALALSACALGAQAQETSHFTFERVPHEQSPQVLLDKMVLEQSQVPIEIRLTPNAPYSAETTSESVQTLADGNRIVHRTVTRVYRDSAGRTRRETLDANGQVAVVVVVDPSTGLSFVLDAKSNRVVSRTLAKTQVTGVDGNSVTIRHNSDTVSHEASGAVVTSEQKDKIRQEGTVVHVEVVDGGQGTKNEFFYATPTPHAKGETEDLGQQAIEGVTCTGKRTTTVVPAGEIGNDQPIKIVSEEWFSPELKVLVLTKHSDPRSGESTYRLTGVTRTEPAKALFEMPANSTGK
jgi:hypothetical protein